MRDAHVELRLSVCESLGIRRVDNEDHAPRRDEVVLPNIAHASVTAKIVSEDAPTVDLELLDIFLLQAEQKQKENKREFTLLSFFAQKRKAKRMNDDSLKEVVGARNPRVPFIAYMSVVLPALSNPRNRTLTGLRPNPNPGPMRRIARATHSTIRAQHSIALDPVSAKKK